MNAITFLLSKEKTAKRAERYELEALPIIQSAHYSFAPSGEIITDLVDIDHSLGNVWNTEIGSDILRSNFGCNWVQHIDKPVDVATVYIIRELMIVVRKLSRTASTIIIILLKIAKSIIKSAILAR